VIPGMNLIPLRRREAHLWERDPHDFYVEPAWCSERLFEAERFEGDVLDPACRIGRICVAGRQAGLLILSAIGLGCVKALTPRYGFC
jgi:hypothetical protein